MKYDYIIWDFNGTILDDAQLCLDILNQMLKERNLPTVTMEKYKEVFGFPIIDYYRKVGFDFDKEPFAVTAVQFIDLYQNASLNCPLTKSCLNTIINMKEKGYHLILLSASKKENLLEQMHHFDLVKYFDEILGIGDIHAASKEAVGIAWKESLENKNAKLLMLGDTLHDAEVAHAIGAECILVAQGHQSKRRLEKSSCKVVDQVDEVLKLI